MFRMYVYCLITLRAKLSGAVYCYRPCLCLRVCNGRAVSEALLQPARAQCLRLSERFFHSCTVYAALLSELKRLSALAVL